MLFFANKKERKIKQNTAMFLVEPTIEEEQEALSSCSIRKARPNVFGRGKTKQSDTDFQHHFMNENQTNVISTFTLSSSSPSSSLKAATSPWHDRNKSKDTYKGKRSLDRHKTKLTSLLIILFGLLLQSNMKPVHLQSTSPPLLLEQRVTTAKSTVFNVSTVPSLNSPTRSTNTKLPSEFNESNKTDAKINSGLTALNETTFNGDQVSATTATAAASLEPSSGINPTHDVETNNSLSDTTIVPTTTSTSDEASMKEEEEGDSKEVSDEEKSGESNKLNKLMLETAGELVDQLVGRIRSPSSSDEESTSTGDELANLEKSEVSESDEDIKRREDKSNSSGESSPLTSGGASLLNNEVSITNLTSSSSKINDTEHSISGIDEDKSSLRDAFKVYDKWIAVSDDIIELFSKKVLPLIVEHGYDVDAVTVTGMLQVFNGIRGLKPWALKLLDSWTKISPGILVGTQSDFGDFDECLNVRIDDPSGLSGAGGLSDDIFSELDEETGLKRSTVVGKYCLADVEFPKPPKVRLVEKNEELGTHFAPIELRKPLLNFSSTPAYKDTIFVETGNFFHMLYVDPLRIGICLTNKIDPDSFEKVFNNLLDEFKVSIHFKGRCVTKYDKTIWTTYQKVSAYIIVITCCLVILSTILDLMHTKLNKIPMPKKFDKWKIKNQEAAFKIRPLFTSFSLIRNTKRLFKPHNLIGNTKSIVETNNLQATSNHNYTITDSSVSSSECSPSIERRSSTTDSAINLISAPSSLSISTQSNGNNSFCNDGSIVGNVNNNSNVKMRNSLSNVQFNDNSNIIKNSTHSNSSQVRIEQGTNNDLNLLCLHGIRVITMTWMIVNHTYLFGGFFVLWAHRRLIDIAEWPKSLSFQLVLNGWLTVETYFFLSAAIIVLNVLPIMKSRKFSYSSYILHRLIRLMPAYIGLVCLNFLWPLISSGPVWLVKGKSFIQTPCENYLWTNFLFVNNWIWPEKQCMVHTWFLSADFQLYLFAPIIVYLLCRRPVYGHSLNIIVAVVASIFSGFVIYANKLMPTTLINKLEFDSIKQQLSYSYFATYQHMGPYCLGIFIGYLLHNRPHVKLPKHLTWCLWLLLPPLSFTTLFLTYLWNGAYDEPNLINPSPLVSAFYVAIHRTIWTSLVAWIVFACATGRAKLMSNFLSHSMFIPLSRLSFSIYLVHLPIIMFRALNLRHTVEWTDSNILWEACGNFVASIVVGYFVNVVFESPFINLEAVIFKRGRSNSETKCNLPKDLTSHSSNNITNNAYNNHITRFSKRLLSREELMRNKNSLQPSSKLTETLETPGSEQNSSDSDDYKSSIAQTSDQHTVVSSPDQDRKLTSTDDNTLISSSSSSSSSSGTSRSRGLAEAINKSTNLERDLPKHMRWTGREYQGSLKVKAFHPKQTSTVGELFNHNQQHQMEPSVKLNYDSKLEPLDSVDSMNEQHNGRLKQLTPQLVGKVPPVERTRRYPPFYDPPSFESSTIDDSLYPITGEYQHYARAGFQQQLHPSRPSQYATLARTSKFNHDPKLPQDQQTSEYLRPTYNSNSNTARIYNSGEPISRPLNQYQREASYLMKQRAQLFQRRQGRYNTLTGGAGSIKQWRKQYEGDVNNDDVILESSASSWQPPPWAELAQLNLNRTQSTTSSSGGGGNFWQLKSGNMIPRVDSSTLRRPTNRPNEVSAGSIVEEATPYEEDEEQEN